VEGELPSLRANTLFALAGCDQCRYSCPWVFGGAVQITANQGRTRNPGATARICAAPPDAFSTRDRTDG
jgi:hypothetical protein